MNRKIIYIIIVIIFFTLQVAKCMTTWQKIEYQTEDLIDLYFDNSSIDADENYVYYRTRTKFANDDFVCWLKSDCKKNLTSILNCKPYSKDVEQYFYNYKDSKNMRSFNSTSPMYLFHNRACQNNYDVSTKANKHKQEIHQKYWKPYILNLEQDIKHNWTPPKQNTSNLIVVKFNIEKNGNLKNLNIVKSSKKIEADKAALEAVKKSAPFKPLPKEFKGQSIPIEFSFDYKIVNLKNPEEQNPILYEAR